MRTSLSLLPWLATFLLHSALLCSLGLLIARSLRAPRAREVVLKGAMLGAFVTVGLQAWLGEGTPAPRFVVPVAEPEAVAQSHGPAELPESAGVITLGLEGTAQPAPEATPPPEPSLARPAAAVPGEAPSFPWLPVLLFAWVTIAAVRLALLARSQRRLLAAFRSRRPLNDPRLDALVAKLLDDPARAARVRLSVQAGLGGPLALGTREIVLPERALDLGAGELEGLLAHELAHLLRRDPLWSLAGHVLERAFFPQVLLRTVRRRLAADAELCCDDWAARRMGKPADLARCLARVAQWMDDGEGAQRVPALAAGMALAPSALVQRVERLLAPVARERGGRRLAMTGVALGLGAVAWAGPIVSSQDPDELRLELIEVEPVGEGEDARLLFTYDELETTRVEQLTGALAKTRQRHPQARFALELDPRVEAEETRPLLAALRGIGVRAPMVVGDAANADLVRERISMVANRSLSIEVVKPGEKVDPKTGGTWSGDGRYTFDGSRRLAYGRGQERFTDLGRAIVDLISEPDLPVVIDAGPGCVYQDVVDTVDALMRGGVTEISFLEGRSGQLVAGAHGRAPQAGDRLTRPRLTDEDVVEQLRGLGYVVQEEEPEVYENDFFVGRRSQDAPAKSPARTLHFGPRGGIETGDETLLVPATAASNEDPYAGVQRWLEAAARSMETKKHGSLDLPDEPLVLRASASTPFVHLQRVMALCGQQRVQIWRLSVAVGQGKPVPTHLPFDLGVMEEAIEEEEGLVSDGFGDAEPVERVEILVRVTNTGERLDPVTGKAYSGRGEFVYDDSRLLQYQIGPRRFSGLDQLATQLARFAKARPGEQVVIDSRGGQAGSPTVGEVLEVVARVRAAGFQGPTFVGAYGAPEQDYVIEDRR